MTKGWSGMTSMKHAEIKARNNTALNLILNHHFINLGTILLCASLIIESVAS